MQVRREAQAESRRRIPLAFDVRVGRLFGNVDTDHSGTIDEEEMEIAYGSASTALFQDMARGEQEVS